MKYPILGDLPTSSSRLTRNPDGRIVIEYGAVPVGDRDRTAAAFGAYWIPTTWTNGEQHSHWSGKLDYDEATAVAKQRAENEADHYVGDWEVTIEHRETWHEQDFSHLEPEPGTIDLHRRRNPAPAKFDVWSKDGTRIYSGLVRAERGYSWPDGFGWITDETIRREGWIVKPARTKQKAVQGSLFDTAPPSRQGKLFDNPSRRRRDRLPGGRADGRQPSDFDPEQLRKGVKVEMEHTNDPDLALEITMDHLVEIPDYYDRLEAMERGAGVEPNPREMDPFVRRVRQLLSAELGEPLDYPFFYYDRERGESTDDVIRRVFGQTKAMMIANGTYRNDRQVVRVLAHG